MVVVMVVMMMVVVVVIAVQANQPTRGTTNMWWLSHVPIMMSIHPSITGGAIAP